ncbi:MAG TPA: cupin domain-containing protein [Candidatus Dormibacteraeota bacterium]|nr:cupin domain-containing protein [Candidatus Dormibacteraeota bacterium]
MNHVSEVVPEMVEDSKQWYPSRADREHALSVRYIEVDGIVPPHSHTVEETLFYIEGTGIAPVGQRELRIRPGTMLVIPPGTVHSTIREGLGTIRYLEIFVGNPEL